MSVLLMTVWLTGCVQEELGSTPSPAGNGIRFTLTVPDVNLPSVSSRTMTGTGTAKKEDEIETVDILVFDMSKTPAVYLEWVSATGVTQDLADNSTVSFSAVLSPTTASTCIVCGISYQTHACREEVWTFVDGEGLLVLDGVVTKVTRGSVISIKAGVHHAVKALTDLEIIEVQLGTNLVEEDIVRYDWDWDKVQF